MLSTCRPGVTKRMNTLYLGSNCLSRTKHILPFQNSNRTGRFMKSEVHWDTEHRPHGFHIKVKPLVYTHTRVVLGSLILRLIAPVWCGTLRTPVPKRTAGSPAVTDEPTRLCRVAIMPAHHSSNDCLFIWNTALYFHIIQMLFIARTING